MQVLGYVEVPVLSMSGERGDLGALGTTHGSSQRGNLLCGRRFLFHGLSFCLAYG